MAYADQTGMSRGRMFSIALVLILHAFLGWAFVTGLAYEAITKAKEKLNVVDIQEEKPPEEEPPPPPPEDVVQPPPPVYTPPAQVRVTTNNKTTTVDKKPDHVEITVKYIPCPAGSLSPQVAEGQVCQKRPDEYKCPVSGKIVENGSQCPPVKTCEGGKQILASDTCPIVKPKFTPKPPAPKGNPGNWANTNDYPPRALQQEREGTTGFRVSVGPDGKVTDCQITASSGHADLDAATCSNVKRRARFDPAIDGEGNKVSGSYSNRVRWVIPK
jgi:periplasmic protein TonB